MAAIVESCDDAVVGTDLQGTIISWNAGAERLFGHSAAEAIGQATAIVVPQDRLAEEQEILGRVARGQRIHHFETMRRRKDGTMVEVSVTVSPVRDAQGQIVGVSKIVRDITERAQARSRLASQLARLQLLHQITLAIGQHEDLQGIYGTTVQFIEDRMGMDFSAIFAVDAEANQLQIACIGEQGRALAARLEPGPEGELHLPAGSLRKWSELPVLCQNTARTSSIAFVRALTQHTGLESMVVVPLRTESEVFAVLLAGRQRPQAFDYEESEFLCQLGAHVSLAARQAELRAELQAACEALERSQREAVRRERSSALARMASGVAHDIDNALVAAQYFTRALLTPQAALAPAQREHAAHALRAVEDIGAMTDRLRKYARRHQPAQLNDTVQLNEIVPQVMASASARRKDGRAAPDGSVDFALILEPGLPTILGSESEIREALVNLVFNALDAMPDGGRLTLRTHWERGSDGPQRVRVDVADNGSGMEKSVLDRCLDPFFTTKGEHGSGMGLAMVQTIALRHGAELDISSEPGNGTSVSLRFPLAPRAQPS